jgi:RHS repeat-associated protein
MTAVFDPSDRDHTQIQYVYDLYGNTTQITYPDGKTIQHTYDQYGRQETSTDINGNITTNKYDRVGLLSHVTQTSPDGKILSEVGYEYDDFGRMTTLTRGNNVTTKYTFTSTDQIKTETTKNGDTVVLDAAYEYDTHGNLTKRVDTRQNGTTLGQETPELVTETSVYTYNAYNQLTTSAIHPGATTDTQPTLRTQYEIGVSGDVTKETTTQDGTVTVREFETNPQAITTNGVRAEQTYDLAGNLTQGVDGTTYTYNMFNQPLTETRPDGTTTNHTYWATGQRNTTTTSNGVDTVTSSDTVGMYWDGTTLTNDTHTTSNDAANTQTGTYLIGASRHTRTLAGTGITDPAAGTNYYVTDRHGNTTATTDVNGNTTRAYTYSDYGIATEHVAPGQPNTGANRNPFQYAGEYTTETGNQYLQARTYTPKTMSFTTKDIAEQFNLYAYANSNPITLVDPTGQTPNWDTIINGIFLGVELFAAFVSAALLTLPSGGASWVAFGVSVTAIAADLTAAGITAAQIANDHPDVDDFISDEDSEILTIAGMALGAAGLALGLAGGGKLVHETLTTAQRARDAIKDGSWATRGDGLAAFNAQKYAKPVSEKVGRIDDYMKQGDYDQETYMKSITVNTDQRLASAKNTEPIDLIVDKYDLNLHLMEQAVEYRAKISAINNSYFLRDPESAPFRLYNGDGDLDRGLGAIAESAYRNLTGQSQALNIKDVPWTRIYERGWFGAKGKLRMNNEIIIRGGFTGADKFPKTSSF